MVKITLSFILSEGASGFEDVLQGGGYILYLQIQNSSSFMCTCQFKVVLSVRGPGGV